MVKWRFAAGNADLHTTTGDRTADAIRIRGGSGCVLFGPYVDLPAGECTARIILAGHAAGHVRIDLSAERGGMVIAAREIDLAALAGSAIELTASIPAPLSACEVRLHCDGAAELDVTGVEIDLVALPLGPPDPDRPVGFESRKTYRDKIESGFFARYMAGPVILEIGYKGYYGGSVPIMPQAIGIDLGYPGYDGETLPFADESVDAIYSSHCFEHIPDYRKVLRDWYRLLKVGGHLVLVVPHQYLFEKRRNLPSRANNDHKRFYTPQSLLREIEESFAENSYRVRALAENDQGFDYSRLPTDHSYGCYEIEVVVEKIRKPYWNLDDDSVRAYGAGEFSTDVDRPDPWTIDIDLARAEGCMIWGPYAPVDNADYEVEFSFEAIGLDNGALLTEPIIFDVAQNAERIASLALSGPEGLAMLRSGRGTLRFSTSVPRGEIEFRLYCPSTPLNAILRFKGAILRYVRPD